MTDQEEPLHIVELRTNNIMRLRAVTIAPDGNLVIIGGENTQGKSSVLKSIQMALEGAGAIPLEPVRHGAREGDIDLALGNVETRKVEFYVERSITAKGTELIVRDADKIAQSSPQHLLNKMCSKVGFDPLAFMQMEKQKQNELLKKIVPGLDCSDIEKKRALAYEQRTNVNREVDRLKGALKTVDLDPTAPAELVDVAELAEKVQAHTNAVGARNTLVKLIERDKEELADRDADIADLEVKLRIAREQRDEFKQGLEKREQAVPPEPAAVDDVREQIRNAEATNAKVRARREHEKLTEELATKEEEARLFTHGIMRLDDEKAERLAQAKFPVDGLGFDDAGPTFNGVPLAQASQAEQLRVSVAIGIAQNPRVRVLLVRDGSRLDKKSMKLLAELARETKSQVWLERVSDGDQGAVIIEDGMVRQTTNVEYAEIRVNGADPDAVAKKVVDAMDALKNRGA